ncbi:hypothetical protein ACFQ9X_03720 [Catenulispora yoronensis]
MLETVVDEDEFDGGPDDLEPDEDEDEDEEGGEDGEDEESDDDLDEIEDLEDFEDFEDFGGDLDDLDEEDDEGDDFAALRALMLSRLAVLPEPAELPGGADFGYDLDDLPTLLDEFAACDEARSLPYPAIVREWGEVFARLSLTEFAGDPPLYGPEKFDTLINVLIPARVNADDAQLELLEPVAMAWARWSTRRVGLAEPVVDYLVQELQESFEDFPEAYGDPVFTMDRHMFGFTMQSTAG